MIQEEISSKLVLYHFRNIHGARDTSIVMTENDDQLCTDVCNYVRLLLSQ